MWNETINQRIDDANAQNKADIRRNSDLRPRLALPVVLALDTARDWRNPYIISTPFDSFYVAGATDAVTTVSVTLGSDSSNSDKNSFPIKASDSAKFGSPVKGCLLTWTAQAGKTITVVFFLGIDFKSGSYLNQFVGQTSIINGTGVNTGTLGAAGNQATLPVTNAAAVQLCPINLVRASFNFYTDQKIWVGDAAVAVGRGVPVAAGGIFQFSNTGALYAIADAAAANVTGMEEHN